MKSTQISKILAVGLTAVSVAALSGCQTEPPEDRLIAVGEALSDTSEEIVNLEAEIEVHEDALDQLRTERRKSKARLQNLEERLEARATDVAIFRAVQTALLESAALQESAISVGVEDGKVTLRGIVDGAAKREQALELARNTAGVDAVVSRILVDKPANENS